MQAKNLYDAFYDDGLFDNSKGTLTIVTGGSAGSFKIDDPRDPENKYLSHSFVEFRLFHLRPLHLLILSDLELLLHH